MPEAAAVADLARSGISPEDASRAGMAVTENAKLVSLGFARVPALVIPYLDPVTGEPMNCGNNENPFVRVRYLKEVLNSDGKVVRYTQPAGSCVRAYFPSVTKWREVFADPTWPIVITEGEKKALALCLQGVACIGLGGVWNWRYDDKLLDALESISWTDRQCVIAYDSDAVLNPQVRVAELSLAAELQRRGADIRLARLTPLVDGAKRGCDDYIAAGKTQELLTILQAAEFITTVEQAVLELNSEVAYIEAEDCVYVIADDRRISKSAFCMGSKWSSILVDMPRTVKGKVVEGRAALAPLWLRHTAARRYAGTTFDPSTNEREIPNAGGLMLNRWRGFTASPGDVTPFLELTKHLMGRSPPEMRDLPIKLMAFKAQNPARKFPIALVFLGKPGSGKSAWPKCIAKAMKPYGVVIPSAALRSDFNEFVETSLLAVIDEAQAIHTLGARDALKNMISEQDQRLNKKHVSAAQVRTYTQFALTANDRGVGAYESDDRRMVVVGCPPPLEEAFYDRLFDWLHNGGDEALMHYLLSYDLKGWTPPKHAPMTAEKAMAYEESLTPVQRLAFEMVGADENVVKRWLDAAMAWARVAANSGNADEARRAKETTAMANSMPLRPFYTPDELSLMFPAISGMLMGNKRLALTAAGAISRELRNSGIEYLPSRDDPRGFKWHGALRQFLVIADMADWREPLSQGDFENYMRNCPVYRG